MVPIRYEPDGYGNEIEKPDTSNELPVLNPNIDLEPRPAPVDTAPHLRSYAQFGVFARLPSRPWNVRSNTVRIKLELTIEDISASRTRRRLRIRTQPIVWAASNAVSAT
jgi:hypothetical protein